MSDFESHCGRKGCECRHEMCYKGWIDSKASSTTSPCVVCRSSLYDVLSNIPGPGKRGEQDQARIRGRFKVEGATGEVRRK